MEEKKRSVLVLDAQLKQAIYITQSLGKKGIRVSCLSHNPYAPAFYSKYCTERIHFKEVKNEHNYIDFLTELVKKRTYELLLPCRDYSTKVVSRHRDCLMPYTRVFLPSNDAVTLVTSKSRLTAFAMEHAIPVPKTIFPKDIHDLENLIAELNYPVVIKGDTTTGARKVSYAKTKNELLFKYQKMKRRDPFPIVQQYIRGDQISLLGLCDNGDLTAYGILKRTRTHPPTGGLAARCVTIDEPQTKELASKLLHILRWNGTISVGFQQDYKTKQLYLLDFNPRFAGNTALMIQGGVDLPYLLYKLAVKGEKEYVSACKGKKYRSLFKEDIFYALQRPFAIPKLLLEFLEPKVYYGFDKLDPLPFIYMAFNTMRAIAKIMKRKLRWVKKRKEL